MLTKGKENITVKQWYQFPPVFSNVLKTFKLCSTTVSCFYFLS